MPLSTHPFLVIYVAWHPDFAEGSVIARVLYDYYRRQLYENVAGGAGLSVIYRSTPELGSAVPIDIDFKSAETSAIVLLIDEHWVQDQAWVAWGRGLMDRADDEGLGVRVFPVAIEGVALNLGMAEQVVRWDIWEDIERTERERRLITDLTYQFCRMLRSYLEGLNHSIEDEQALAQYLRKVKIFLSHSKHDSYGESIASRIRDTLHESQDLDNFFDVHNIPAGLRFHKVILQEVRTSAVVAIHTDSYSSREWCRREIIEAKRSNVPLVVANCISDVDERSFPYMGNVPVVRMDPDAPNRIDYIITRLLDEVLKDFLWKCRVKLTADPLRKGDEFLPRPPELISLTILDDLTDVTLVYPDPPIGAEEQRLFEIVAPSIRILSMTQWLAETAL